MTLYKDAFFNCCVKKLRLALLAFAASLLVLHTTRGNKTKIFFLVAGPGNHVGRRADGDQRQAKAIAQQIPRVAGMRAGARGCSSETQAAGADDGRFSGGAGSGGAGDIRRKRSPW